MMTFSGGICAINKKIPRDHKKNSIYFDALCMIHISLRERFDENLLDL